MRRSIGSPVWSPRRLSGRLAPLALLLLALAVPGRAAPRRSPPRPAPPDSAAIPSGNLDHYLDGLLLEERGMDQEALDAYRAALEADPGQPTIELRIAEVTGRLGQANQSLEAADQVLAQRPGDPQALWLKGGAQFNLGHPNDALVSLQAAVARDSEQVDFWKTLAYVAETLDRIDLVREGWRHAVELDGDDGEGWFQLAAAEARLGHFADADSMLAEAIALNPGRPGTLFLEGWIREGLGRKDDAIRLYRQHLEVHPGDQSTRRRLVALLADTDHPAEALKEAEIMARAQPGDPEVLGTEAELALRLGREQRARELFDEVLAGGPDDPARAALVAGVLVRRGRGSEAVGRADDWARRHPADFRGPMLVAQTRAQVGDTLGAIAAARSAVVMAPDSLAPRFAVGGLLQSVGRFAEAESVWVDLARGGPAAGRAGLDLAFCREQLGNVDGAIRAVRDVLAREPDNARALNSLGYILADHGRNLGEAEKLVQRALQQDPDNGSYVDSMGWVYYRLGRLDDARRELERAVGLTGGDPVVREHLGDVYAALGLQDLARDQYRRSLATDGGNARVRAKLSRIR